MENDSSMKSKCDQKTFSKLKLDKFSNKIKYIHIILETLRKHQLYAKLSKCKFIKQCVEYTRYFISEQGITIDSRKIDTIHNWPTSTNISELRSFFGLASYYRKFVKGFSAIASPLIALLHKDQSYK